MGFFLQSLIGQNYILTHLVILPYFPHFFKKGNVVTSHFFGNKREIRALLP